MTSSPSGDGDGPDPKGLTIPPHEPPQLSSREPSSELSALAASIPPNLTATGFVAELGSGPLATAKDLQPKSPTNVPGNDAMAANNENQDTEMTDAQPVGEKHKAEPEVPAVPYASMTDVDCARPKIPPLGDEKEAFDDRKALYMLRGSDTANAEGRETQADTDLDLPGELRHQNMQGMSDANLVLVESGQSEGTANGKEASPINPEIGPENHSTSAAENMPFHSSVGNHMSQLVSQDTSRPVQDEDMASIPGTINAPPPFGPPIVPNTDSNHQAYMMMALANLSVPQPAMSPPPTVTPAQVSLAHLEHADLNGLPNGGLPPLASTNDDLKSFARLEFQDSVFQMTTYAVIVGRDQRALRQARRDEKLEEEHARLCEEHIRKGLPPPTPIATGSKPKFTKSYVSEEGGMLGPASDDSEDGHRPAKRRRTSIAGSSQYNEEAPDESMILDRQYVSHTPGAAAVDLQSLRPSIDHIPFIGIHSPGPNISSKTKAISREHLKIAFNTKNGVFEAIPLHRNGFFCDDIHYNEESRPLTLKSGDRLQIKDVDFVFVIYGVKQGRTGAKSNRDLVSGSHVHNRAPAGGKEMSFDFEGSRGDLESSEEPLSDLDDSPPEPSDFGDDDDDDEGDEGDEDDNDGNSDGDEMDEDPDSRADEAEGGNGLKSKGQGRRDESELSIEQDPDALQAPKKRGPGRPPKNGIMSKREQRLLKKQQQEMARKTVPEATAMDQPLKRKVGRPRKHPLPDEGGDQAEKRKYKPRKPKGEENAEGSEAERRAKEKKERKVRPKSPPLELKIEDYTEEQLQKPNKNYGVLIDECLTAAGAEGLTLKQIYKRISQKYPWYHFHTGTNGWQSSVRHNLIGNEAFKKDETTNIWLRVLGVELDAGKKRKASSPDRVLATQGYGSYSYPYHAGHRLTAGINGYPVGPVPPGYQAPNFNGQHGLNARPTPQYGNPALPNGQTHQHMPPLQAANTARAGYAPPIPTIPPSGPQFGNSQSGPAFTPPYTPQATNSPAAPIKSEDGTGVPTNMAPPVAPGTLPGAAQNPVGPGAPQRSHSGTPNGVTEVTQPARPIINPRLLQAVKSLKTGLATSLKKAQNPQADAIVFSALNRCLGFKNEVTENEKMEAICMKGLRQLIEGYTTSKKSPTPGSLGKEGTSGSDKDADFAEAFKTWEESPRLCDFKAFHAILGFRNVTLKALEKQLGPAKAQAVALSAIDRALGFADASMVPTSMLQSDAEGGNKISNFEGVEQHLIKSIRQLLSGMNYTVIG